MELADQLHTAHVYLSEETLQQAIGASDGTVRLNEEFGVTDPLLEQTVLALDCVGVATSDAPPNSNAQPHR
ncbi:hypothetical protein ACFV80_35175 [Streptomyces sp. NPDC059862]|uniref:hypothetical protein n=1 Tax=Streptomyces sp. NPDC059862 TaxID=3346975 RepID=UPI0036615631